MILVTGASGKTGQAILRHLAAADSLQLHSAGRGLGIRALVHRDEQVAVIKRLRIPDAFVGDLRSGDDLARALNGVQVVYHICPNMQPDEVAIGERLITIAKEAGVQRIVYHSVLHPHTQEMPHHWKKLLVEELLLKCGLAFTVLQPGAYMQNVLALREQIVAEAVYQVPYATTTRLGMVDLNDVAEVAAKVLIEPGHDGAIYELATNEWLTVEECAQFMSKCLGRPIAAVQRDRSVWQKSVNQATLSEYAIETLLRMFRYYEEYGFCGNGTVLTALLGRRPTPFAEFLRREFP